MHLLLMIVMQDAEEVDLMTGQLMVMLYIVLALVGLLLLAWVVKMLIANASTPKSRRPLKRGKVAREVGANIDDDTWIIECSLPGGKWRSYVLEGFPVYIGRAKDNHITINHHSVSRRHARIDFEAGTLIISDLSSSNGLQIDGVVLKSGRMLPGNSISIGRAEVRVRQGKG